jgi:hypothetical protein
MQSSLVRLPRALQVICLGYLENREITRVAHTCEGLREFSALRVCCFGSCLCREQSPHGIAMASDGHKYFSYHPYLPNGWLTCSGCRVSIGCFLSLELWQQCRAVDPPCDERYCMQCTPVDVDGNEIGWECALCKDRQENERYIYESLLDFIAYD